MLVCIGSKALSFRLNYLNRVPNDLDVIGSISEVEKLGAAFYQTFIPIDGGNKIIAKRFYHDRTLNSKISSVLEAEIAWENRTAAQFVKIVESDPETVVRKFRPEPVHMQDEQEFLIPSLDLLYLLKMSHRYLKNSPHFLKTMRDIHLLRQHGAKIPEQYQEFFRAREKETYNYSHPKLNQSKNNFFSGDGVTYVYDHDAIHEVVKMYDQPAYKYFKAPDAEVLCDKNLFFNSPEKIRLAAVLEEAYVLALERSQIPFRGEIDFKESFEKALEKVCTSITSGWFRQYAWEHYFQAIEMFDPNYALKFFNKADKGEVKSYEGQEKSYNG